MMCDLAPFVAPSSPTAPSLLRRSPVQSLFLMSRASLATRPTPTGPMLRLCSVVWAWGQRPAPSQSAWANRRMLASDTGRGEGGQGKGSGRGGAAVKEEAAGGGLALDAVPLARIRNFSIIAHVDHGKSTLSDRLLQMTNTIKASARAQYMDKLQVEQERGITVKAQTATLFYKGHLLNLIDTPGHVDFSYEVSRSLAACEGVLLIVDASQGVEAQTLANFLLASKQNLAILPVVNKIDLPNADIARVADQCSQLLGGVQRNQLILVSGKTGAGVSEPIAGEEISLLDAIIERIPAPSPGPTGSADLRCLPSQALIFDTWFDPFRGVVSLVRLKKGTLRKGDFFYMKSTGKRYEVQDLGIMHPEFVSVPALHAGQVGCILANVKTPIEARVGDTIVVEPVTEALPGFDPPKSMVFAGVYPMDASEFDALDKAMSKLTLNDASVSCVKESSNALGLGFRCGFLGLLHMDVFRQRLEQEFAADVIITSPTVPFKARLIADPENEILVSNPSLFPEPDQVISFSEPVILATIITPGEYLGSIMDLCVSKRGEQVELDYLDHNQARLNQRFSTSNPALSCVHACE